MKRAKKLIIFTAILAVLIIVYFVVTAVVKNAEEDTGDETAAETYALAEVDASKLVGVKITKTVTVEAEDSGSEETSDSGTDETETLIFTLSEDATKWLWSEDKNVPLDNSAFASMVTNLSGAASSVKYENVSDEKLGEYGLLNPDVMAEFEFEDGSTTTFRIGKYNSFSGTYYCTQGNDTKTVYMVSESAASSLDVTVEDMVLWDETPEVTEAKITTLKLEKDGKKYVYTYYPTGKEGIDAVDAKLYLSVDGGEEIPITSELETELINAITDISFKTLVQYTGEVPDEYGFASPVTLTLDYGVVTEVTDSDSSVSSEIITPTTYVLTLGAMDDDGYYYVKTADSQLIYTLYYSDVFESAMPENPEDVRYVAEVEIETAAAE